MIIFILIFFASIVAVGIFSVLGFSFYLKRRRKSLETNNQKQFIAPPYRSLFEPDDEEFRALEREERAKAEAEKRQSAQKVLRKKAENAREFQEIFLNEPNRRNTIELFLLAAKSESAKVFSVAAENVIQVWRARKIKNLSAPDLADLLDSHLRTLPQQERTSGALFWLKREIENLRRKSE